MSMMVDYDGVNVVYASESGNAQSLAEDFAKRCGQLGLKVNVLILNEWRPQSFANSFSVLFLSTTGQGELPINGRRFLSAVEDLQGSFESVHYALFALGNPSYQQFCGAGKKVDALLKEYSATAKVDPVWADTQYQALYASWTLALFSELTGLSEADLLNGLDEFSGAQQGKYQCVNQAKLTQSGALQETYHVVLQPEDEALDYQVGDTVSILPDNETERVESLLAVLELEPSFEVGLQVGSKTESVTLQEYLTSYVEITKIGSDSIKKTAALLADWTLLKQASSSGSVAELMAKYDAEHWFKDYPIPLEHRLEWVKTLPQKTPRFYSLACSPQQTGNQLHLTVGLKTQVFDDSRTLGLGSGFLTSSQLMSSTANSFAVTLHPNSNFRWVKTPSMVWVAVGTGIAPFIGFLLHLESIFPSERPLITLYFGVRNESEYLYRELLEDYAQKGVIDLQVVYSRQGCEKRYVQHQMAEQMADLASSLQGDGHVYVCGSEPMWEEVEGVLQQVAVQVNESVEAAEQWWGEFVQQRLHKDIY